MYTQKAGLIFGGNPAKDKPHGPPLCWVACGGVLWCPPNGTGLEALGPKLDTLSIAVKS